MANRKEFFFCFVFGLFFCTVFSQEARVADLKVQGNSKTKASFIKKIAKIRAGALLDSLAIEEDIKVLKRLPSIAHASYQVFLAEDNSYNVFYDIVENFTLIPSANFYRTNNEEFAYRLGLYEFNLLGQNIILGGFFQKDIFNSYAVNFRAPYLFNNQFGLALSYQDLTTQEPVYFNDFSADYKYNNASIEVMGLYQINFKNRIEIGLNFFKEDYQYISGAPENAVIPELNVNKYLYKGIYEYNNLKYDYQYVSGFRSVFNFQYVINRDMPTPDFIIGRNDFLYYARIGKRGNWANRVRVGFSSNEETPFAPFSVDNNVNIRGVGIAIDRGTAVVLLNTEYRHTLLDKKNIVLQSNVFIDAGTWRKAGGTLSDFSEEENIKVYPGLGFRLTHKKIFNATFRVDYGYGITKDASHGIVFGIGQYF